MNHFDQAAPSWDTNSVHWERSQAIAEIIQKDIPLNHSMKALEFGAGTGILSFMLKDVVEKITMMDNSSEMVKVMEEKVVRENAETLHPKLFDLEKVPFDEETFDLIFTQMAMHHVADIKHIILQFYTLLNPGGYVAIADLYPEDGSFHGDGFTGHLGFNPVSMASLLTSCGFNLPKFKSCFVVKKQIAGGETKDFPVFILIAQK